MPADKVLKAAITKQIYQYSFDRLHFHLLDSRSIRSFVGYGLFDKVPKPSTLSNNIKKISAITWEAIHQQIIHYAMDKKIEKWKKIRTDATVVETNIRHPLDSSLLWDSIRTLINLQKKAKEYLPELISFKDHTLRAKRR